MQSRVYQKRYPDGTVVERTAYEVSVSKIELLDGGQTSVTAEAGSAVNTGAEGNGNG